MVIILTNEVVDFLSALSSISGIIAIIIVVWDHFKDDRRLTKRIQEFYNDIENLIYSNYKYHIIDKEEETQVIDSNSKEELVKIYRRYRRENYTYRGFIKQKFDEYSRYRGITYRPQSGQEYIINNTDLYLLPEGRVNREIITNKVFQLENITKDYLNIQFSEIEVITKFLDSLKEHWKNNYGKKLFRPELKSKIDFENLMDFHNFL